MSDRKERDEISGTETTGHEWDGIKELNTPMPRWWLWTFYATIVWAIGYWILMPAWPGITGYTHGVLHHSQRAEVAREVSSLHAARTKDANRLMGASLEQIEGDPQLLQFALAAGASAFGDNCLPCHGAGGQGAKGYPNLADDAWLWGGKLEDIQHTITVGVRSTAEDTRTSAMLAFGRDKILTPAQIDDVVQFVLKISGRSAKASAAARGAEIFAANCASCHGPEGKGGREFGAPNLTDEDWLYDGSPEGIRAQIFNPKLGVMPTWGGRIDKPTIKALAVYVHSLGGGE